jgi:uncharacterized protein
MSKLIFWLVIVFVALFGLRLLNAAKTRHRAGATRREATGADHDIEATVRCARCGVYLPKSEARDGPAGLTCGDAECARFR